MVIVLVESTAPALLYPPTVIFSGILIVIVFPLLLTVGFPVNVNLASPHAEELALFE